MVLFTWYRYFNGNFVKLQFLVSYFTVNDQMLSAIHCHISFLLSFFQKHMYISAFLVVVAVVGWNGEVGLGDVVLMEVVVKVDELDDALEFSIGDV